MTKTIIIYLSAALFIFAMVKSSFQMDFARTKNDHLIEFKKRDIEEIKSIDSVKSEAKHNLELLKESRHKHSDYAKQILFILILIFCLQLFVQLPRPGGSREEG